jgi:hypothetical protein
MRLYTPTWHTLKTTGKASVTVSIDHVRTVVAGVIEAKADENKIRKMAGLPRYSKLIITRTKLSTTHIRVDFSFVYSINL